MMMNNLTLYCNCFGDNIPRHTQYNQKNLMCGASQLTPEKRKELEDNNFLFDDTGDNISHLNPWLGDLTGLYWVWKNTTDDFVGTNQYRRFYEEGHIDIVAYDKDTFYVSNPYQYEYNIYEQFKMHHTELPLLILHDMAMKGAIDLPFTYQLQQLHMLSSCNMFFCSRPLFNSLCEVLFKIIFELYDGLKYALPHIQPGNQTRMIAFLSERILTLIFNNINYYFKDGKIQPICMRVI